MIYHGVNHTNTQFAFTYLEVKPPGSWSSDFELISNVVH